MVSDAQQLDRRRARKYDELLEAGKQALETGKSHRAYKLWREAATLEPGDERAWVALLDVIASEEDRRVCLQNIISINPGNERARRLLHEYQQTVSRRARQKALWQQERAARRQALIDARRLRSRRTILRRAVIIGVLAGLLGVLGGVLASLLVYVF